MKTYFLISSTLLLFIFSAKAQQTDTLNKYQKDTTIYVSVEHDPEFPGGIQAFYRYVGMSLRFPADARAIQKQGKVIVQMVVEKDGSITNVKVLRKLFPSYDAEAVRVVSNSPKWLPGMQNGYPLRVTYTLPISFELK